MNPREQGFLLLTSYLGDPDRRPLTIAQFRDLTLRARNMVRPQSDRIMTEEDLVDLGYNHTATNRILTLLSHTQQLDWYLHNGKQRQCFPLTRINENYPLVLHKRLGAECPGSLWVKGDISLLYEPAISVVGSRDLNEPNLRFAQEAGSQAAKQGYVLISGNARGADKAAQQACLEAGGKVICVVADPLEKHTLKPDVLYIAEDGFDLPFSAQRALQRNRIIHCLGQKVLVAQSSLHKGGTWSGTAKNLAKGYSPVFCFDDSSAAAEELSQMGAQKISLDALSDLSKLQPAETSFID